MTNKKNFLSFKLFVMKKYIIIWICLILASCGKTPQPSNIQQSTEILTPNIKHLEAQLKKTGVRWEKLKKYIKQQKEIVDKIKSFTGEKKEIILIQQQVLPSIQKQSFTPKPCKNIHSTDLFISCAVWKNIKLNQMIKYVPKWYQQTFKKLYYKKIYTRQPSNLFKKTNDPIAIEAKKSAINNLKLWWVIKQNNCDKIPETSVKSYCKNLFKK